MKNFKCGTILPFKKPENLSAALQQTLKFEEKSIKGE